MNHVKDQMDALKPALTLKTWYYKSQYGDNLDFGKINTGNANDYISNNSLGSDIAINACDGSDIIFNSGINALIDAGAGDDFVHNTSLGSGSTIDGGNDNDTIENRAENVIINGGNGADTIVNYFAMEIILLSMAAATIPLKISASF